jgi:hypothetical protein
MSMHIEVHSPSEQTTPVRVRTIEPVRLSYDETMDASHRYQEEAQDAHLSDMERIAKLDTADFLAKQGLALRIKQYKGE